MYSKKQPIKLTLCLIIGVLVSNTCLSSHGKPACSRLAKRGAVIGAFAVLASQNMAAPLLTAKQTNPPDKHGIANVTINAGAESHLFGESYCREFSCDSCSYKDSLIDPLCEPCHNTLCGVGSCFSRLAKIQRCVSSVCEEAKLGELQVGDSVAGGQGYQERIVSISHNMTSGVSSFFKFNTQDDASLKLTRGHYAFVVSSGKELHLESSELSQRLAHGESFSLIKMNSESSTCEESPIVSVEQVRETGMILVTTESGTLNLEGFKASSVSELNLSPKAFAKMMRYMPSVHDKNAANGLGFLNGIAAEAGRTCSGFERCLNFVEYTVNRLF